MDNSNPSATQAETPTNTIETHHNDSPEIDRAYAEPRNYDTIGIGPVFLTTGSEILGIIKSTPEDFIVQEIRKAHNSDELVIADIENVNDITSRMMLESKESTPKQKNPRNEDPVVSTNHVGDSKVPADAVGPDYLNPPESQSDETGSKSIDPIEKLQAILEEMSRSDSSMSLSTFEQLKRLNDDAVSSIASPKDSTHEGENLKQISVSILVRADFNTKMNRSLVHDLVRQSFPLLISDTVKSEESSGDAKLLATQDLRFFPIIPLLANPTDDLVALYRFYRIGYTPSASPPIHSRRQSKRPKLDLDQSCEMSLSPQMHRHDRRPLHSTIATASNGMLTTTTLSSERIATHWAPRAKKQRAKGQGKTKTHFLCLVQKRQCEHLVMLHHLSQAAGCYISDIGFAGIKDRQAITTQFCTLPRSLSMKTNSLTVIPLGPTSQPLRKGALCGNRFRICLRHVQSDGPLEIITSSSRPFINFFGTQRVGEPGPTAIVGTRTLDIGRAMAQGDFYKAIALLMVGRRRGKEEDEFRRVWRETDGDIVATYDAFSKGGNARVLPREQAVLKGLKRHGKDKPLDALRSLPRNERLFFLSAYQSFIWNKMATKRIQLYGMEVRTGDLVHDRQADQATIRHVEDPFLYRLDQVVLPLPGCNVLYPANEIGELYRTDLANDNAQFVKGGAEESTPKGSYRPLIAAAENIAHEVEHIGSALNWNLSFDLPVGAYATIFLREIMRTTASTDPLTEPLE